MKDVYGRSIREIDSLGHVFRLYLSHLLTPMDYQLLFARHSRSITGEKESTTFTSFTDTHRETYLSSSKDNDPGWEALVATDLQSTQGSNRARGSSLDRNESRRGLGSACMRYSPSGSHLAIGCKNGCLVIMAMDPTAREGSYDLEHRGSKAKLPGKKTEEKQDPEDNHGPERDGVLGNDRQVDLMPRSGGDGGTETKENFTVSQRRIRYCRVACLKGHSSRILHLDWTTDGRFVQTCGQDYQVLHWEILPPDDRSYGGTPRAADFRPRIFLRPFLLRDAQWATWSSTVGWPVQVKWNRCFAMLLRTPFIDRDVETKPEDGLDLSSRGC